nr:PREDICTED: macrophage mannose receptor 1-like [Lepisosteus oculatus]
MDKRNIFLLLAVSLAAATGHVREFHFVEKARTWAEARRHCREAFTDLATLRHHGDIRKLLGAAASSSSSSSSSAWIGLHRGPQAWRWADGKPCGFVNWRRGLFCARVDSQGAWEDRPCFMGENFMCSTDSSQGSRTYTLIEQSKTWAAARDHCRQQHTDLVTISSPRENQATLDVGTKAKMTEALWKADAATGGAAPGDCQLVEKNKTWTKARGYCRRHGGELLTARGQAQLQELHFRHFGQLVRGPVWIGLYHGTESWQWVSGERASYANWKTRVFCATAGPDGYWTDVVCDELHYFMCYTDSSQGSRTYTLIEQNKTWAAARDHCRQQHTDLVTISNVRDLVLVKRRLSWEEALDFCRSRHTDLTSVLTEKEQAAVARGARAARSAHVWLGLRQSRIFGFWFWVNQEPMGYQNWGARGEPQLGRRSSPCGAMSAVDHTWTDRPCEERLSFICYRGH